MCEGCRVRTSDLSVLVLDAKWLVFTLVRRIIDSASAQRSVCVSENSTHWFSAIYKSRLLSVLLWTLRMLWDRTAQIFCCKDLLSVNDQCRVARKKMVQQTTQLVSNQQRSTFHRVVVALLSQCSAARMNALHLKLNFCGCYFSLNSFHWRLCHCLQSILVLLVKPF